MLWATLVANATALRPQRVLIAATMLWAALVANATALRPQRVLIAATRLSRHSPCFPWVAHHRYRG
ncbi:MAG: hypothetical protein J6X55_09085, partial [Victivallales bacterium]|nr:hypothetical protein [Victivallales bacterium]